MNSGALTRFGRVLRRTMLRQKPAGNGQTFVFTNDRIDPADPVKAGNCEEYERARFGSHAMTDEKPGPFRSRLWFIRINHQLPAPISLPFLMHIPDQR